MLKYMCTNMFVYWYAHYQFHGTCMHFVQCICGERLFLIENIEGGDNIGIIAIC